MRDKIDPSLISVRNLEQKDLPFLLSYWFRSPPGYLDSLGINLTAFPPEKEMEQAFHDLILADQENSVSQLNALTIVYDGFAIGFHSISALDNDGSGIFHAHIWDENFRNRGIGKYSYISACKCFFQRFNLQRILFYTPAQNLAAIHLKESLGIRCTGTEIVGGGVAKENTTVKIYELLEGEVKNLNL